MLLTSIFSCEKILDVDPTYLISGDEAIRNKRDVETAINGVYLGLQQTGFYGRHMVIIPDLVADNLVWRGTTQEYGQFENNTLLSDNTIVASIWAAHYTVLNRLNYVLYKLPEIKDMTNGEKEDAAGQLYFIRALTHFNLVRLFGAVPIKTEPTLNLSSNLNVARNPVNEVYQQIVTDLAAAQGKIVGTDPGYASNAAVLALQAKVALYMGNYDLAISKSTEVINSGHTLATSFNQLFNRNIPAEIIFVILFNEKDDNRLAEYFFPTSKGGRYEVAPSQSLIAAYEPGDSVRFQTTIGVQPPHCNKYTDIATMANNVYVIRLAEMYLIRAEARARNQGDRSEIRADINTIRTRAELNPISTDTYAGLLLAIEQEHRREFAFEGHRWFEIVRTGRAIQLKPSITNTDQLLFPIPLTEIQNNTNPGMYQNRGY